MAATPWLTSNSLLNTIKIRIMLPDYQVTLSDDDILLLANQEMMLSQVPAVMQYHAEYFTSNAIIPLEDNRNRYPIPERAIASKIRDLFFQDSNNNLYEMTCINADDISFYQPSNAPYTYKYYYIEGNDVVIVPNLTGTTTGNLYFRYYLRPGQLVVDDRAAIISSFGKQVTVDNSLLVAGDTITIDDVAFTAVAGVPSTNEFQIAGTSVLTASNLVTAINTNGIVSATNGSGSSATVLYTFSDRNLVSSVTGSGLTIGSDLVLTCTSVPSNITSGTYVDLLQTKSGHKTYNISILLASNSTSATTILIPDSSVSTEIIVGDYICSEYECIIPQIPTDLHSGLAERTCARILEAQSDFQGLQVKQEKLAEIYKSESTLLENRDEGSPKKVSSKHSLLKYSKKFRYRGF